MKYYGDFLVSGLLSLKGFVCLCFTSLQHRGHLETAPPFTVPCEGHTLPTGNRTPGRRVAVHYAIAAPRKLHKPQRKSPGYQNI